MKVVRGDWWGWPSLPLIGGLGVLIHLSGYAVPAYTDQSLASALKLAACTNAAVHPGWYDQLRALDTLRHPLMQAGLSIALAALTVLALRRKLAGPGPLGLRTPTRRWTFFGLGLAALGISWGGQMTSVLIRLERGEFPWCADSITIPMHSMSAGYGVLAAICLAAGAVVALALRDLPQELLAWQPARPVASLAVSLPFAVLGLAIAGYAVVSAPGPGFLATPASVIALYLVEATRAALVGRLAPALVPA